MNTPDRSLSGTPAGGIIQALAAAALFGASTPLVKPLLGDLGPVALAGLLYLSAGLGLLGWYLWRRRAGAPRREASLTRPDFPWLLGAVLCGGMAAPVLLMVGLASTPAASAALLLNLEGVLTALLAWFLFHEHFDRRILAGMAFITAGGALLSWDPEGGLHLSLGALAIAGACLAWAVDNNLTRRISASDPVQVAGIKGLVAGLANLGIALYLGAPWPPPGTLAQVAVIGFLGYGASLVLFILALRSLGTARTGAYFSAAPFIGVLVALVVLGEVPQSAFWLAFLLMGAGVWLHVTERHAHAHEPMRHAHAHVHDEHHRHAHEPGWDGREPHSHVHDHPPLVHIHPHFPDLHHRHRH